MIAFAAVYSRTQRKYGERGARYVHMEVGHSAQNVWLQVVALGLSAVVIGAFDDMAVQRILSLPKEQAPLLMMPIGRTRNKN